MPPRVWMQSWTTSTAASIATTAAMAAASSRDGPDGARAASHTAARASSVAASIRAQRCLTAWNCPIGRPNWCLSFAYSGVVGSHSGQGPCQVEAVEGADLHAGAGGVQGDPDGLAVQPHRGDDQVGQGPGEDR